MKIGEYVIASDFPFSHFYHDQYIHEFFQKPFVYSIYNFCLQALTVCYAFTKSRNSLLHNPIRNIREAQIKMCEASLRLKQYAKLCMQEAQISNLNCNRFSGFHVNVC